MAADIAYNFFVFESPLLPLIALALVLPIPYIAVFLFAPRLRSMTDRQLQLLGLGFALIGVATQFISPILTLEGVA
jgi:hypothetical protein